MVLLELSNIVATEGDHIGNRVEWVLRVVVVDEGVDQMLGCVEKIAEESNDFNLQNKFDVFTRNEKKEEGEGTFGVITLRTS